MANTAETGILLAQGKLQLKAINVATEINFINGRRTNNCQASHLG